MSTYQSKNFQYNNPAAYDTRSHSSLEKYIYDLWTPLLRQAIREHVTVNTVVCDLGCGTLAYTQFMGQAKHIYAVDVNENMVAYGRRKTAVLEGKIEYKIEDATHTTVPGGRCDVIWSVGLTEYVNVNSLWQEIDRISHSNSRLLIQFPNRYHPWSLAVQVAAAFLGKKIKRYRSLAEIKKMAGRHSWQLTNIQSVGFFLPGPPALIAFLAPFWKLCDRWWQPFTPYFPLGINVWCEFVRR